MAELIPIAGKGFAASGNAVQRDGPPFRRYRRMVLFSEVKNVVYEVY